jgi:hypothetical protein
LRLQFGEQVRLLLQRTVVLVVEQLSHPLVAPLPITPNAWLSAGDCGSIDG